METSIEYLRKTMPDLNQALVCPSELDTRTPEEIRTDNWLKKRAGRITASIIKDLMTKGRGKETFGQTAIKAMQFIKYERRTGIARENKTNRNFKHGHEFEPEALKWYADDASHAFYGYEIKSCATDFPEIVFQTPFAGFGDSPDFFVYHGPLLVGVGEIKCPVDQSKIENLWEFKKIDSDSEYYYQILGHFLGTPDAEWCDLIIYDAFAKQGKIFTITRSEVEHELQPLQNRLQTISMAIDHCIEKGYTLSEYFQNL